MVKGLFKFNGALDSFISPTTLSPLLRFFAVTPEKDQMNLSIA